MRICRDTLVQMNVLRVGCFIPVRAHRPLQVGHKGQDWITGLTVVGVHRPLPPGRPVAKLRKEEVDPEGALVLEPLLQLVELLLQVAWGRERHTAQR